MIWLHNLKDYINHIKGYFLSSLFSFVYLRSMFSTFQLKYGWMAFLLLLNLSGNAEVYFDFNAICKQAYAETMELKTVTASDRIQKALVDNPENAAYYFIQDYIDFFEVFIGEDEAVYNQRFDERSKRLAIYEQLEDDNPWKNYAKGELYVRWAIAKGKYQDNISALWDARRGYKLHEENLKRFPEFQPSNKTMGFLRAVVGTIPDKYQFAVRILGFDGDVKGGMQQMDDYYAFAQKENLFKEETHLMHTFFLIYLDQQFDRAWEIASSRLETENSLLNNFLVADIAYRSGKVEEAIQIVEARPSGAEYIDFYFMDYFEGLLKLCRLDEDANVPIERFLNSGKGIHYVKEAWQRLGWHHLFQGDTIQYFNCLEKCKTEGRSMMDADKQALKDANDQIIPNIDLLKARLLNDGGYNSRSLEVLNQTTEDNLNFDERSEFYYRSARVYDAMGRTEEAIFWYKKTIDYCVNSELYYPAKSCLQLGMIYEKQKQFDLAKNWFEKTNEYNDHPYVDSFEQQSKAALNRLKDL